jgi:hypothetical protein
MTSGAELNNAVDMTEFMSGVDAIAREFDCVILLVRHFRKSSDGIAINQGLGSIALAARARSMLVIAKHPKISGNKAVAHAKSNFGPVGPTILFSLVSKKGVSCIHWHGVDEDLSADELLSTAQHAGRGRPPEESKVVETFLRSSIGDKEVDSRTVFAGAKAQSFSKITVRRVARAMGVKMRRDGLRSFWSLPTSTTDKRLADAQNSIYILILSTTYRSGFDRGPNGEPCPLQFAGPPRCISLRSISDTVIVDRPVSFDPAFISFANSGI